MLKLLRSKDALCFILVLVTAPLVIVSQSAESRSVANLLLGCAEVSCLGSIALAIRFFVIRK